MEAELIEEQELLDDLNDVSKLFRYTCTDMDGNPVIIATSDEVITVTECDLQELHHEGEILEVYHHDGHEVVVQANITGNTLVEAIIQEEPTPSPLTPVEVQLADSKETSSTSGTRCDECGIKFKSKKTLKLHKTIHVDEALYACEFCSATQIHWTEMWLHQCTNADSAPIVCPQCHKVVSTKKQLQVHEEVHELQRRFSAKRMAPYFQRKLQEAEEPAVDWGAKPFICGVCGKPFSKLYEVEYHEKLHTGDRPPPQKCAKCGLSYLNKHDLNKHTALGCIGEVTRKTNASLKRKQPPV